MADHGSDSFYSENSYLPDQVADLPPINGKLWASYL